ncbi:MAG: cell division protein FtsW [Candidatus Magasanikbacteria bacterium RIFCSPHIGHO2_01_FULL_41_23]|uniref:Probable peptidoglycan glycosyltransferase FtsW n=1 Tax=Candidatus Magasanikbacteria bacterium RIFCSPLOWO2_01_FULL_40_15 TaxID=1798686 RepID=A0A1F6N3Y8_9BACT|nr:MAG: cell division protein FtsW [Candidatus Magasanikbacteria bacterium RIFCSPHIGHO2_01_FULL_41_23]OGH76699.1 MAG: cell division protein FtsW [Candidatus Magasanikbacteria bacterium RIFCSPHIGHO2_12_FULL_41_16]OGH78639.1 MAG: cell division protein FtsW [Candidatus Magasanikbacteria bacterium RIFCSPLOWO2_01_FULL_40_15]
MERRGQPDYQLLGLTLVLLIFGLLVLTSASSIIALHIFNDSYYFVKHQIFFGLIPGILVGYFFYKIPTAQWQNNAVFIMGVSLTILVAVLIPGVGETYDKNARSWINLFGFSFQPAEFVKLGLILFFSAYLLKHKEHLANWQQGFFPALIVGLLPVGLLMLQPDVGTASIIFTLVVALLFFAGARLKHITALLVLGIIGFASMVAIAPYRLDRLTTFLHPELDPLGVGYQINQAYLAIGSGGIFGLGLGHSRQKFQYLPEVHADSIFAILAEEGGFMVTLIFIFILYFWLRRLFILAKNTSNDYDRLLVSGIAAWIMSQSFLNIGAIIGLLPLTGVPLPLVSHGGTSLLTTLAALGIVARVSQSANWRTK